MIGARSTVTDDIQYQPLAEFDPDVAAAIAGELGRQRATLEMIASENFVPRSVLQAQGSVFTNKYAEGYPGRRYYGGCENSDIVENLACDRAKALFGAEFANVQPHAGAQANAAVLMALANPGDKIMGLALAHGGHLTHGMRLNFSGKLYQVVAYEVDPTTFRIDMDRVREQALAERPQVIIAGWSAYPRHQDFAAFRAIADEVGAKLWVDMAHFAGLNSAVFPGQQGGPLMHAIAAKAVAMKIAATDQFRQRQQRTLDGARILAERLTAADCQAAGIGVLTGGTDVHLALVDLRNSQLDGKQAEDLLHEVGITVNRNAVPFDPRPPMVTSGLRIGTPALATRGFDAAAFTEVADIIAEALTNATAVPDLQARVAKLADAFPLYDGLEDWCLL